jgi:RNA polymerase sigma factor (sigma-70 family)
MAATQVPPFQSLLDEHATDVLGFLVASVGPSDAEDCFQETLIAALRSYPELRHGRNLRAWLLTIAHRKAIDHHRSRARRAVPAGGAEQLDGIARPDRRADPDAEGTSGPDRAGELWSAVSGLPPKQRSAVVLRFATGMSHREIGRALDCSEEAARRNVHEGLKSLREELR